MHEETMGETTVIVFDAGMPTARKMRELSEQIPLSVRERVAEEVKAGRFETNPFKSQN